MSLNLPPKEETPKAPDADTDAKPKRATPSTAALAARVSQLEKLVGLLADAQFGKNVRPALPDDDDEGGSA